MIVTKQIPIVNSQNMVTRESEHLTTHTKKSSVHKGMQPEGKKRIKELQNNRKTIRGL